MRKIKILLASGLLLFAATACGDDDDNGDVAGDADAATATKIDVTASEYAFDVPATFEGGTVEMSYTNAGKEPHFAAFAKVADGKTYADVKAALSAAPGTAPAGPPPFTEWAGAPTADPGGAGKMAFDLPEGTYALFCSIPSPDGQSHAAKGMVTEVTVTSGTPVDLPEAVGTITGTDFALTAAPDLKAGSNVVQLRNDGKQLHELNLVEFPAGKTLADLTEWAKGQAGPPPASFQSGVAVAPGEDGTTEVDLKEGSTYAFVCLIPDTLGDFAAHLTKGMATSTFTI